MLEEINMNYIWLINVFQASLIIDRSGQIPRLKDHRDDRDMDNMEDKLLFEY